MPGNQLNTDTNDTNPFRYCGEYYDAETGNYYLRARYYDPSVGRFTQQDTHWNIRNMIYGDTMQRLNVTVDAEGMESFTAIPQLLAIRQAGNLYGYAANNPVAYIDPSGLDAIYVSHRKWGEGGLPVVGHAFLYFESGGNWYFTEFDGKTKRDAKVYLSQELSKESIDQYLKSLSNATIVYIEGDFSASLEIAQRYDGTNYSGYHFFKNNCLDYVQEVMHAGQCSSYWVEKQMQTSKQIVPQFFAVEMMTGIPMTVWLKLLWFGAFGTSGGG